MKPYVDIEGGRRGNDPDRRGGQRFLQRDRDRRRLRRNTISQHRKHGRRNSSEGLGSKFGHLDSGSTLHFLFKKLPEKTESNCFIDTWVIYRSARNDDCRGDSL